MVREAVHLDIVRVYIKVRQIWGRVRVRFAFCSFGFSTRSNLQNRDRFGAGLAALQVQSEPAGARAWG